MAYALIDIEPGSVESNMTHVEGDPGGYEEPAAGITGTSGIGGRNDRDCRGTVPDDGQVTSDNHLWSFGVGAGGHMNGARSYQTDSLDQSRERTGLGAVVVDIEGTKITLESRRARVRIRACGEPRSVIDVS